MDTNSSISLSYENARLIDNMRRVDAVAKEALSSPPPVVVQLMCYNKSEADELSEYTRKKYPEVVFFSTYMF